MQRRPSPIILTCGHRVFSFADCYDIDIKSSDREGNKAVSSISVCKGCLKAYRKDILKSEAAITKWLHGDEQ